MLEEGSKAGEREGRWMVEKLEFDWKGGGEKGRMKEGSVEREDAREEYKEELMALCSRCSLSDCPLSDVCAVCLVLSDSFE